MQQTKQTMTFLRPSLDVMRATPNAKGGVGVESLEQENSLKIAKMRLSSCKLDFHMDTITSLFALCGMYRPF